MRLTPDLPTDVSIALRRFASGTDAETLEEAAVLALREYVIGTRDLEIEQGSRENRARRRSA